MHVPVAPKTRTRKWPGSEDAPCDLNSSNGAFRGRRTSGVSGFRVSNLILL